MPNCFCNRLVKMYNIPFQIFTRKSEVGSVPFHLGPLPTAVIFTLIAITDHDHTPSKQANI